MASDAKIPLSQQVAQKVRDLILKNELSSGQKLNEKQLCDQLGVSRTPLREAIRLLNAEGLVQLIPNRGACVTKVSIDELDYTFAAMGILEGNCARLATERLTDADMVELEMLHNHLEDCYERGKPHEYMKYNHKYHAFVQEKAGNPVLSSLVSRLHGVILLQRYQQIYKPGRLHDSLEEHRRLIEAFRARDGVRAERLMQTHLHNQCKALLMYYAGKGQSLDQVRETPSPELKVVKKTSSQD